MTFGQLSSVKKSRYPAADRGKGSLPFLSVKIIAKEVLESIERETGPGPEFFCSDKCPEIIEPTSGKKNRGSKVAAANCGPFRKMAKDSSSWQQDKLIF